MRYTGLKFLFPLGTFVSAVVSEQEAKQIIQDWMNGNSKTIVGGTDLVGPLKGMAWAVKMSEVQGIHTFDPQQGTIPQPLPPTQVYPYGRSGIN